MSQENKIIEFNQDGFRVVSESGDGREGIAAKRTAGNGDCESTEIGARNGEGTAAEYGGRVGDGLPDGLTEDRRTLAEIQRVMAEITKGNLGTRAGLETRGREGGVLTKFNQMLEMLVMPIKTSAEYFEKIANGSEISRVEGNYPGDLGLLEEKINGCVDSLAAVTRDAEDLSAGLCGGVLETRAKVSGHSGKWAGTFEKLNAAVEKLVKPLIEIEKVMDHLAKNDFTVRVQGEYQGEYGRIKNSINGGIDNMANLMLKLRENANQLSMMSEQMAKFMENSEFAAAASVSEAKPKTEDVKTEEAKYVPDDQAVTDMKLYSEEIGKIVTVIDEIAAQISLLALNAAIECAAATENGPGLATIADDIRKLAEKTTEADKRLGGLIRNAHDGIQQAIIILSERNQRVSGEQEG